MRLIIRWVVAALALFAAAYLVPGIRVEDPNAWVVYALMAVILGLVNAVIRPILRLLSCPLIILTLGVFLLLINAISFLIAARIAEALGVGFFVDGFGAAFLGSLVVSVVTVFFNIFLKDPEEKQVSINKS
ncbi:MAG TPA: phage holin family protein [Pelolinea sp.]|nr:phage holin family protein [Pelolinea sp.]